MIERKGKKTTIFFKYGNKTISTGLGLKFRKYILKMNNIKKLKIWES